jgi:hypothetical protein
VFDNVIEFTSQRRFATKRDSDPLSLREQNSFWLMILEQDHGNTKRAIFGQIAELGRRLYWFAIDKT